MRTTEKRKTQAPSSTFFFFLFGLKIATIFFPGETFLNTQGDHRKEKSNVEEKVIFQIISSLGYSTLRLNPFSPCRKKISQQKQFRA